MASIKNKTNVSILIPTYNGAAFIKNTLQSIFNQTYPHYEIIICDDASTDETIKIIESISNPKIRVYRHSTNLGYPGNLERGRQYCRLPYLYLVGQDDILSRNALELTIKAFFENPEIGAASRHYYWFHKNPEKPVRAKKKLNSQITVISTKSNKQNIIRLFDSLDQLTGLCYKRDYIRIPFHPDIFPCHIYPFADIFINHPVAFLPNYTVAVRIASSQTRQLSSIYNKSPILSWCQMIDHIFSLPKYKNIKNYLVKDFIATNYVGLIQIRNYSTYKNLFREIYYLLRFRWQNIVSPGFWLFSLGSAILPPSVLIPLVDWYKENIYSQTITNIKLD